eukprot:TRINITY_DN4674_c0_g3_i1.p1 TRINITY_DN4674_c0_g3~~TRINITY_DN4674_c0_g3_i1.p1  ORF type:complete len:522 (+),score=79.58 TRINITY_DN4674_c0_g3_i1:119-1684(+)
MTSAASCESSINDVIDCDRFGEVISLLNCIKERQDEMSASQALQYQNLMMEMSRFHSRSPEAVVHIPTTKTYNDEESMKPLPASNRMSMTQRKTRYKSRQTTTSSDTIEAPQKRACLHDLVKSSRFDTFSAFLLITNTIFLGVQVDYGYDEQFFYSLFVIDSIYAVLFAIEITLRLLADGLRTFFSGDERHWNIFDFVVVGLSTIDAIVTLIFPNGMPMADISVVRIIRTVRITRVLRIIRVMKFFREMRIMIAAIASTLKTAFWAFCLTIAISYVFAIAITQLVLDYLQVMNSKVEPSFEDTVLLTKYFGGVARSLLALFMSVTGGISWEDALRGLFDIGVIPSILMLGYILFTSLCMLNVIVGIFCQNAVEAFDQDKERVIEYRMLEHDRYVDMLTDLFNEWDVNGEGKISVETFLKNCEKKEVQALLQSMEVDTKDAVVLFELLDAGEGNGDGFLDLSEFVEGCITVRGTANAIHMEKAYAAQKTMQQTVSAVMKKVNAVYSLMLAHLAESSKNTCDV